MPGVRARTYGRPMTPRVPLILSTAALVLGGGAAAIAATADSLSVQISNSKSLRRLAIYADVGPCDFTEDYTCYKASWAIYDRNGKRIYRRGLQIHSEGHATARYNWSCAHTGRLGWRVRVSDGKTSSTRHGHFHVRC